MSNVWRHVVCLFLTTQQLMVASLRRWVDEPPVCRVRVNSGSDDPLTGWLHDIFGKWAGSIKAVVLSVAVILTTHGCCCVPFERTVTEPH